MSAKNKHRICAYCGQLKKATVDHVPPKLLLEQPFPRNLLTVPACEGCNKSFAGDDEYTRTVLLLDVRAAQNPAARCNLPAVLRSLYRPKATRFVNYLAERSQRMSVIAPNGLPLTIIQHDRDRINNTGLHIMRGLYFLELKRAIPAHAVVQMNYNADLTPDHPDMI